MTPEQQLDTDYRNAVQSHENSFLQMGILLCEIERTNAWERMEADPPYRSLEDFMVRASGKSLRTAYSAKNQVRDLLPDIPLAELQSIPSCNREALRTLSSAVRRDPAVREAARLQGEQEFNEKIVTEFPDQHFERKMPLLFRRLTVDQRADVMQAFKMVEEIDDCHSPEDKLQAIAVFYRDHPENKQLLKNIRAERVNGMVEDATPGTIH